MPTGSASRQASARDRVAYPVSRNSLLGAGLQRKEQENGIQRRDEELLDQAEHEDRGVPGHHRERREDMRPYRGNAKRNQRTLTRSLR